MEQSIRNTAWILICLLLVLVLLQFDALANEHLMGYGLIYRGFVWGLMALMLTKALMHFGELYTEFVYADIKK